MFAVFDTVRITDFEKAREDLLEQLPHIKETPGLVSGCWLAPTGAGTGMSVTVYDSEEAAKAMSERMPAGFVLNEYVTIETSEVREVVATF